ncbi:MAG: non-canonical purine NTP pyrophosphatase [Candidatus Peribacteraceae bacterium]
MQLFIGTNNDGKVIEIRQVLDGLPVSIVLPADLKIQTTPVESGDTFEENARIKARYYFDRAKLPTVADDSGIIVEALADELGIHTRRWGAGPKASDEEWIGHFLERMKKEKNKRARFVCALAYIDAAGITHTFDGVCDGVINPRLEAGYLPGLPISACFMPDGFDRVYSAMTIEQKNSTSHRGRAVHKLADHLRRTIESNSK